MAIEIKHKYIPARLRFLKRVTGVSLDTIRERMAAYLEVPKADFAVDRWYGDGDAGPKDMATCDALAVAMGVPTSYFFYKRCTYVLQPSLSLLVTIEATGEVFTLYISQPGEL